MRTRWTRSCTEQADGAGRFVQATLRPSVTIASVQHVEQAEALHATANAQLPIFHQPTIRGVEDFAAALLSSPTQT